MNYVKVKSLEHLDKMLARGENEFFMARGILRSSKYITKEDKYYFVYHYIDDFEEQYSAEELMQCNIGAAIRNGNFYCETTNTY